MVESQISYNIRPNVTEEEYWNTVQTLITTLVKDKKIKEFRAFENLMGDPQIKASVYWNEATHFANFAKSDEWRNLLREMRKVVSDIKIELWGPSRYLPDPVVVED
ncbi:hypothetical protein [Pleionea mediterranea]|jgi:hypothetical protein|uniref:ABM domain-containing protein n=1 Tax=Pleionea mediterranea TaxID=523701 RepID=A0A316FBT6_9GAMM|nr:hypothetical protein [Pleionea mediterranea]PWK46338.1 hypothetical protein C8D97_11321 [Pleionea mediterranea]